MALKGVGTREADLTEETADRMNETEALIVIQTDEVVGGRWRKGRSQVVKTGGKKSKQLFLEANHSQNKNQK